MAQQGATAGWSTPQEVYQQLSGTYQPGQGAGHYLEQVAGAAADSLRRGLPPYLDQEVYRLFKAAKKPLFDRPWQLATCGVVQGVDALHLPVDQVPELPMEKLYAYNGCYALQAGAALTVRGDGVVFGSLREAEVAYPELVGRHYGKLSQADADELVALQTALSHAGTFLYVPDGVRLEMPLELLFLLDGASPLMVNYRNLIILGEHAKLGLLHTNNALAETAFFSHIVSEIYLGAGARLELSLLQTEHAACRHLHSVYVEQQRDSEFSMLSFTLHGGIVRNVVHDYLRGAGASASICGLSMVDAGELVELHTDVHHEQPSCTSNQLYKAIVDQDGQSNFYGVINVHPDAQKSDAYQKNANILLGPGALVRTRPQLIIHADDVKCSHGASTGRLDAEQLFYLTSRGIPRQEAYRMLLLAFAQELAMRTRSLEFRNHLERLLQERLMGKEFSCQ